jgi:hypothetical protein
MLDEVIKELLIYSNKGNAMLRSTTILRILTTFISINFVKECT